MANWICICKHVMQTKNVCSSNSFFSLRFRYDRHFTPYGFYIYYLFVCLLFRVFCPVLLWFFSFDFLQLCIACMCCSSRCHRIHLILFSFFALVFLSFDNSIRLLHLSFSFMWCFRGKKHARLNMRCYAVSLLAVGKLSTDANKDNNGGA